MRQGCQFCDEEVVANYNPVTMTTNVYHLGQELHVSNFDLMGDINPFKVFWGKCHNRVNADIFWDHMLARTNS